MDYFQTNALHLSIMILPLELGPLPSPPPIKNNNNNNNEVKSMIIKQIPCDLFAVLENSIIMNMINS